MRFIKLLFLFLITPWLLACSEKAAVRDTLKGFVGTEILLPLEAMRSMRNGRDTILARPAASKFKAIIFVDSSICTSCVYKSMYKWIPIIEEAKDKSLDVEFLFILHPAKASRIGLYHEMMQPHIFGETVLIDTAGVFSRSNPSIPDENIYHSFLLDEENRVVMVGDPTRNKKLHDLFVSELMP